MKLHLTIASALAYIMDNQFRIGRYRFGLSALIDLFPGIGDIISAGLSLYIVWIAIAMKVPNRIIVKMIVHIGINFILGSVPIIGDVVYLLRKVNTKNLKLLREYLSTPIVDGELLHMVQ